MIYSSSKELCSFHLLPKEVAGEGWGHGLRHCLRRTQPVGVERLVCGPGQGKRESVSEAAQVDVARARPSVEVPSRPLGTAGVGTVSPGVPRAGGGGAAPSSPRAGARPPPGRK